MEERSVITYSVIGLGILNEPSAIAVDSLGNVYVTDTTYGIIQKFSKDGKFITKWGSFGINNGEFRFPSGIVTDPSDNVYVSDTDNRRIQKFTNDGKFITKWGSVKGEGELGDPHGIAIDSLGNFYVADSSNHRVQVFRVSVSTPSPKV